MRDDATDLLPQQLWNNELLCLVLWQSHVSMTSLGNQYELVAMHHLEINMNLVAI